MMKMDFSEKTAIVTGGTRGIGKTISEILLELGCSLIVTSASSDLPGTLSGNEKCRHFKVDLSNRKITDEFCEDIKKLGPVDILINNAGIQIAESADVVSEGAWAEVMDVNLSGPMKLIKHVSRKMKEVKKGKILNISSISGIVSKKSSVSYSVTKAGIIGLTRSAALDLAEYGILVNALCPGYTQTDMMDSVSKEKQDFFKDSVPLKRFADTREIANFAVFLCSDLNTYITGQTVIVDGGVTIQ
jgi:3-oxoacyl-[acyl-carrier protein] reductase